MGKQNKNLALVLAPILGLGALGVAQSCLDFSVEFSAGFDLESWGLREVLLELTVP